jgi:hypothetical protein
MDPSHAQEKRGSPKEGREFPPGRKEKKEGRKKKGRGPKVGKLAKDKAKP